MNNTKFAILIGVILVGCGLIAFEVARANRKPTPQEIAEDVVEFLGATTDAIQSEATRMELEAAEIQIGSLKSAILSYRLVNKKFPMQLSDLMTGRKYLLSMPLDPWGNSYLYLASGRSFTLYSAGPDGIAGTGDDVRGN